MCFKPQHSARSSSPEEFNYPNGQSARDYLQISANKNTQWDLLHKNTAFLWFPWTLFICQAGAF